MYDVSINVDFFLQKANSRGREFLFKLCFLCIRCTRKNITLLVKYFLGDYKLKFIEILYTRSGQYCPYKGPHLKKILKPRAALIGIAEKKVYTSADVLFSPLKTGEEQKKSTRLQMFFFSLTFSAELNKKRSSA